MTYTTSDWNGRLLATALQEAPSLSLEFYSFGVLMRQRDGDRVREFAVDPAQVALALAAKVTFDTGLLGGNTLLVQQVGVKKTVVEYRPPQKTGLYFDNSDVPLRVPLPGLILIRCTTDDQNPQYRVFAVKRRPETLDAPLYHPPLPNVFNTGSICWGSVRRVTDAQFADQLAGRRLVAAARLTLWHARLHGQIEIPSARHPPEADRTGAEKRAPLSDHRSDPGQANAGASFRRKIVNTFDPHLYIQQIVIVGLGGTGAQAARIAGRILYDMRRRRMQTPPLLLIDPDRVEEKNVGRQMFTPADIGAYKAAVVGRRLNLALGAGHGLDHRTRQRGKTL